MDYIFPDIVAKALKKPSQRTLMEASLLSLSVMIISIVLFSIYVIFFTGNSLFIKILTGVNGVAGFFLLGSYLATSYIQYYAYKKMMGLYGEIQNAEAI